jgi:class 3 adenylate cyclase/tetratricopeptide (TPR) repeat protein
MPPQSERRLVSVLFADLVGFTTLSEHRDPEEIRDLLSQYFDRCRTLIERYGGTVEKFIGDAVMAVWGTPVAREDDAERSVRAALSLTQAVARLGEEVGMPELRVRAGVLTGSAAVEVGAEGEGMVLGDTVNTASRLQSIAAPGTVLVDDVTRRASEAAITYEDAGEHQVKGREQPVKAWTALRVVAGAGGARRSAGLEAPFVGRERELQTIIDAAEDSAIQGAARLVTVVGEAGVGKSRLLWEYFKYVDGVEKLVRWHQGRCLAYGEGVAYWALAEMVRSRASIVEEEDPASARAKLRATVEEFITDERERRLVEPRLAHLLGLEQRSATDRADLFSGWRLFFERIADTEPVVMVFEDLQWADSGLLDFIDYLLEWSAEHPIFILALGRPELHNARPEWPEAISLRALDDRAMTELLDGLVPGLPEKLGRQIRARAEGVPLYAVETVRMLLDRGLIVEVDNRYTLTGEVSDLEVPETLQALVAARLDDLEGPERSLVQDAAVIGQSFMPNILVTVSGRAESEVKGLLKRLVDKQVLAYIDDVRLAERGQYAFLQELLRTVALSTLARRDRKAKHLAVARHLEQTWGDETGDIAEVLASHYLDAVAADPEAEDADTIRDSACLTLMEAGRRASSLALGPEARRHFAHAAELSRDQGRRGELLREAGSAAFSSGENADALQLLQSASDALEAAGAGRELARVESLMGLVLLESGQIEEADSRLGRAYAGLDGAGDEEAFAEVAVSWSRVAFVSGDHAKAVRLADAALPTLEGRRLNALLVNALTTKAIVLAEAARPAESSALLRYVIDLAVEEDLGAEAIRGYFNLAENLMGEARFAEAQELLDRGLGLARRRGDRRGERWMVAQGLLASLIQGRWDDALTDAMALQTTQDQFGYQALGFIPFVLAPRGDTEALKDLADSLPVDTGWAEQDRVARSSRALIQRELGDASGALPAAMEACLELLESSISHIPLEFGEAVDTAFSAGEPEAVAQLLRRVDALQPVQLIPMLDAEAARARARLAEHQGQTDQAKQWFKRSVDLFRELGAPFHLARAQVQLAEFLGRGDEAAPLSDEAAETFAALGAQPWLARARALGSPHAAVTAR